jgi:hypothetical protein
MRLCVCVRACVRACTRACVCVFVCARACARTRECLRLPSTRCLLCARMRSETAARSVSLSISNSSLTESKSCAAITHVRLPKGITQHTHASITRPCAQTPAHPLSHPPAPAHAESCTDRRTAASTPARLSMSWSGGTCRGPRMLQGCVCLFVSWVSCYGAVGSVGVGMCSAMLGHENICMNRHVICQSTRRVRRTQHTAAALGRSTASPAPVWLPAQRLEHSVGPKA